MKTLDFWEKIHIIIRHQLFCNSIAVTNGIRITIKSWYECGKTRLIKYLKQLTRTRNNVLKHACNNLTNRLAEMNKITNPSVAEKAQKNHIKTTLDNLFKTNVKAAEVRSRIQWAEEGEVPTAYFLRQEKLKGQQKLIGSIKDVNGQIKSSQKDILAVWRDFYYTLLSADNLDENEQSNFLNSLERSLTSEQAASCEGPITINEATNAVKEMASNKSPGIDGLPIEFFHKFWDLFGPDLLDVFNFVLIMVLFRNLCEQVLSLFFTKKAMPRTQLTGVLFHYYVLTTKY